MAVIFLRRFQALREVARDPHESLRAGRNRDKCPAERARSRRSRQCLLKM